MAISKSFEELLNTDQKKLAFFQNLVLVAVADGYLDETESNFLVTIGDQLGLTEEQTQPIAQNISVLSFIIPEDGLQKTMELQTLVMMMLQDGDLEESEYKLCADYARRIGYSQDTLDEMIEQLKEGQG